MCPGKGRAQAGGDGAAVDWDELSRALKRVHAAATAKAAAVRRAVRARGHAPPR